jgi:hypothetical protein
MDKNWANLETKSLKNAHSFVSRFLHGEFVVWSPPLQELVFVYRKNF